MTLCVKAADVPNFYRNVWAKVMLVQNVHVVFNKVMTKNKS